MVGNRAAVAKYRLSQKGKATKRRYLARTRKQRRAWQSKYDRRPHRKLARQKWARAFQASPEGKERIREIQARHDATPRRKRLKKIYGAKYMQTPKGKAKAQRCFLRRRYGLSGVEYWALVDRQNGRCAICAGVNKSGKRLYVDHDHATGKVRALLCHACNTVLGHARDNSLILRKAAQYLTKHKEN